MGHIAVELTRFARRTRFSAAGGLGAWSSSSCAGRPLLAPRDPLKADFRAHEQAADAQSLPLYRPGGRDTLSRVIYGARTLAVRGVLRRGHGHHRRLTLGTSACGFCAAASTLQSGVMEILAVVSHLILAMASPGPSGTAACRDLRHRRPSAFLRWTGHSLGGAVGARDALRRGVTGQRRLARSGLAFHVLPQCVSAYLVLRPRNLGAPSGRAALGFLGVGVPPPTPTGATCWRIRSPPWCRPWWLGSSPASAITVTVLAFQPSRRRHPRHASTRPPALVPGILEDDVGGAGPSRFSAPKRRLPILPTAAKALRVRPRLRADFGERSNSSDDWRFGCPPIG